MIVSILQLMGFTVGKPVHSRAEEGSSGAQSDKQNRGQEAIEQASTRSVRRSEVKAPEKKSSKTATGKSKPDAKSAAKSDAKSGVKSDTKAPEKAAKKAAPAVKAVAKAAPTVTPKATTKATTKPTTKTVAKPAPKVSSKPETKPATKPASKPAPKAAEKASAKPVPAAAPEPASAPVSAPAAPSSRLPVPPVSAGVAQGLRAGRPSSRLAQLTVPSMAQSVASTAAKASYSQSTPSPVIVPALPSSIKKDAKLANNWKTKPVAELTDAELLAMSDDEYMNEVQLAAFRLKLQGLKLAILNSAGETTEHLREDTSVVPDPADRATIEEEHALELRTRDRERKLLKKIEQSIARIDAGDYGYCDETGEPIGVGRLLARPTATLSLEAQQRRELKQKMFGD